MQLRCRAPIGVGASKVATTSANHLAPAPLVPTPVNACPVELIIGPLPQLCPEAVVAATIFSPSVTAFVDGSAESASGVVSNEVAAAAASARVDVTALDGLMLDPTAVESEAMTSNNVMEAEV